MENQNHQNHSLTRGRPPKKFYDPEKLMQKLIDTVSEVYQATNEIKATALELSLSPNKVKKLLITVGMLKYLEAEQIQSFLQQGKTMEEIQTIMGLSYSTINTYLPCSRVIYKMSEVSQNTERVNRYKIRKQTVENLQENCTEENLWKCIVAFQEYPFYTACG